MFPTLHRMIQEGKPFFKLWKIIDHFKGNYQMWMEGSFHKLNYEKVALSINGWSRTLHKFAMIEFQELEI
jgi:hypothetical protein